MTGGRVVVLGPTGKNFAAGMSGGIAYVYDENGTFPTRCNKEMVLLSGLDQDDSNEVVELIQKFQLYTESELASEMLKNWEKYRSKFVKVYPNDYRRVLETQKRFRAQGLPDDEAIMAAFEENVHDLARSGGK